MKSSRKIISIITGSILLLANAFCLLWVLNVFGTIDSGSSFYSDPKYLIGYIAFGNLLSFVVSILGLIAVIAAKKERLPRFISGIKLAATVFSIASFALLLASKLADLALMPSLSLCGGVLVLSLADYFLLPKKRKSPFVDAIWAFPLVLLYGAFLASFCFVDLDTSSFYGFFTTATAVSYCYDAFGGFAKEASWIWIVGAIGAAVIAYFIGVILVLSAKREEPAHKTPEEPEPTQAVASNSSQEPIEEPQPEEPATSSMTSAPAPKKKRVAPHQRKLRIRRAPATNILPPLDDDTHFLAETIVIEESKPKEPSDAKAENLVYHISQSHRDGLWLLASSDSHETFLFVSLPDAVNYAEELVKTNGGSIRIHTNPNVSDKDE